MKKIEKKVWPIYFQAILDGNKKYELRINDFAISVGDELFLREWDPKSQSYTGRELTRKVTYVGKFRLDELFWSKEDINKHGLQIISLE